MKNVVAALVFLPVLLAGWLFSSGLLSAGNSRSLIGLSVVGIGLACLLNQRKARAVDSGEPVKSASAGSLAGLANIASVLGAVGIFYAVSGRMGDRSQAVGWIASSIFSAGALGFVMLMMLGSREDG